jgi:hypothetical protein
MVGVLPPPLILRYDKLSIKSINVDYAGIDYATTSKAIMAFNNSASKRAEAAKLKRQGEGGGDGPNKKPKLADVALGDDEVDDSIRADSHYKAVGEAGRDQDWMLDAVVRASKVLTDKVEHSAWLKWATSLDRVMNQQKDAIAKDPLNRGTLENIAVVFMNATDPYNESYGCGQMQPWQLMAAAFMIGRLIPPVEEDLKSVVAKSKRGGDEDDDGDEDDKGFIDDAPIKTKGGKNCPFCAKDPDAGDGEPPGEDIDGEGADEEDDDADKEIARQGRLLMKKEKAERKAAKKATKKAGKAPPASPKKRLRKRSKAIKSDDDAEPPSIFTPSDDEGGRATPNKKKIDIVAEDEPATVKVQPLPSPLPSPSPVAAPASQDEGDLDLFG